MADMTPVSNTTASAPVDQLATSGTRLVGFRAGNSGAAAFVQLFDARASVANGTVPLMSWPVGASTTACVFWPAGYPRSMASGILVAGSAAFASYVSTGSVWLIDIQSA